MIRTLVLHIMYLVEMVMSAANDHLTELYEVYE